jgi:ribose/xylose/arabinose/galactoside ABC-type transport system permease subunit
LISTPSGVLVGELVFSMLVSEPLGVDDGRVLGELGEWLGAVLGEVLGAVLELLLGLMVGGLVLRTPVARLIRTLFGLSHMGEIAELLTGPIDGLGIDELRIRSIV